MFQSEGFVSEFEAKRYICRAVIVRAGHQQDMHQVLQLLFLQAAKKFDVITMSV